MPSTLLGRDSGFVMVGFRGNYGAGYELERRRRDGVQMAGRQITAVAGSAARY